MAKKKSGRIKLQTKAAEALGVTPRTLRDWSAADWWDANFRNAAGYDVEAIAAAVNDNARKGSTLSAEREKLRHERDQLDNELAAAKVRAELRKEQESLGNVLPREEYEEFVVEIIGMLCDELLEIPRRMLTHVPKSAWPVIFVDTTDDAERAELDRLIRYAIVTLRDRLHRGPDDTD